MEKIAVLLPYNEFYDQNKFGAIALTIKDFINSGKYKGKVTVFGCHPASNPLTEDYQRLELHKGIFTRKYKAYLLSFLKKINTGGFSMIEIHNRPKWIVFLSSKTKLPIRLHLHNDPLEMQFFKTVHERESIISKSQQVICVSDWVKQRVIQGLSHNNTNKVLTVYNTCIPISTDKENIILYVGRITYEKGVIELFDAIKELLNNSMLKDWKFMIVGKSRNKSNFNKAYRKLKNLLSLENDKFIYIENMPYNDVINCFAKAKIAVLPSKWPEPFGRTILEALAGGCALITSNTGAIPEIVKNNGICLPSITAENINNAILKLVADPSLINEYSTAATNRALEFSK